MTETKLYGYVDMNRLWLSSVVVLLFTAIHLPYLFPGAVTSALYYVMVLIGIVSLFGLRENIRIGSIFVWATGAAALSLLNTIIIGNQNVIRTGILFSAFFLAALFLHDEVDEKAFAISVYINALFVLVKLLQNGVKERVYDGYSNNYVSILLLSPAVLYYAVCSARRRNCSLLPAAIICILSFLMGGRGGVLSTGILLMGVILHKYFKERESRRERVILGIILCIVLVPMLVYGMMSIFQDETSDLYIVERVTRLGMDGGQRLDIWSEYITDMGQSWQYLLFGVKQDIIINAQQFAGNLHNSFLFVHAYLGIIGFVVFVGLVIRAFWKSIQSGKWLYFCTLFTFAFRGFTDHVFGSNRISAIMIALVLLPDFIDLSATKKNGEQIQNQL